MPHLEHIGLAVEDPEAAAALFEKLLDARPYKAETVADQGVRTHFIHAGTAKLELLEALGLESPVARFIEKRGEGVHHLAFEVEDIEVAFERMERLGFTPLSEAPTSGADAKRIFFLHPKQTGGVLVEFCQSVPAPLEAERVPYRDGHLAVYEAGRADGPPLLVLHGAAGCTQFETAALVRCLAPHFRVLALDFAGHGASDAFANAEFSADLFADNARAVLDHFGLEKAHVFGFSMGGYMALYLAQQRPERVRRLAVHGACIRWDAALVQAMTARLDTGTMTTRAQRHLERVHADWQHLLLRMIRFVHTLPARSARMDEIAAQVRQPTLVSAVDRDDLFPLSAPLHLHERLPRSRLALFPGERHVLQYVDLDLLAPLLSGHLGRER